MGYCPLTGAVLSAIRRGMEKEIQQLLRDVHSYLKATGMAISTLGKKSVNDGKCIGRLRAGGRAWPETLAKIRKFMTENPPHH
jgi:hypothetical protein